MTRHNLGAWVFEIRGMIAVSERLDSHRAMNRRAQTLPHALLTPALSAFLHTLTQSESALLLVHETPVLSRTGESNRPVFSRAGESVRVEGACAVHYMGMSLKRFSGGEMRH